LVAYFNKPLLLTCNSSFVSQNTQRFTPPMIAFAEHLRDRVLKLRVTKPLSLDRLSVGPLIYGSFNHLAVACQGRGSSV
jgi:hypothetical protein